MTDGPFELRGANDARLAALESGQTGSPVGAITAYYGATAPAGWLLCDGTAIPAQYTKLIALVGANTPNLKGKVIVGVNAAESEWNLLGETGGAKTHTLVWNELVPHQHVVRSNDGGNAPFTINKAGGGSSSFNFGATNVTNSPDVVYADTAGGGLAHNNLQPYMAIHYIIKAG